jgi:hypothetical protein
MWFGIFPTLLKLDDFIWYFFTETNLGWGDSLRELQEHEKNP